jgi:hypothetical protein
MVQAKEQDAKHHDRNQQDDGRYDHEYVGLTWSGDERRQVF